MEPNKTFDVAIVGYGPTSQLLALLLGQQGHDVVVVERWSDHYPLPRAVHFDHEIGRILQAAGLANDVRKIIEPVTFHKWFGVKGETLLNFDWSGLGLSGWPISNMFSQPVLERMLHEHISKLPNVKLIRGFSAIDLAHDSSETDVTIRPTTYANGNWEFSGEPEKIQAKYLIGADGANSFVRETLGITNQDLGFAFEWLVIDVIPQEQGSWVPEIWQYCQPDRPTTMVSGGPGRRRWEFMLKPGETATEMNKADVAWKLLEPWGIEPSKAALERHAVYTFRGRWADQWRVGRVFLAGDAAHLTPPFAGQGLCSGMRDSMALAWRLDGILKGVLAESVLDSYHSERTAHVQGWIQFAVELGKVICVSDPYGAAERDKSMLAAMAAADYVPPPTPTPRLGAGLYLTESAGSGSLVPQGMLDRQGRHVLFDEVFGNTFTLIVSDPGLLNSLSDFDRSILKKLNARVIYIGDKDFVEVNKAYETYMEENKCKAFLYRPDFYSFGTASTSGDLHHLISSLQMLLMQ